MTNSYYVYVSFTNLNDDSNGTICQQTAVGTQSTQYCADGGVYYLAAINNKQDPCLIAPSGWNSILNFGIFPWWPTSGSARAYRALNPNANANPPVITPPNDEAFAQYVDDFVSANTYDMLDLIGQTPGAWTLPTCDQGLNFWTYDYTNKGGLTIDQTIYQPFPCACGFQGSGTAAFYKALGIDSGDLYNVVGSCEEILLNIDPALPKTEANIGWNAINGGKPTQIVYSNEFTLTPPASLPTQLCQLVKGDCLNSPPSADICHGRPSC